MHALNGRVSAAKSPQIHHNLPSKNTVENAKPLQKHYSTTPKKNIQKIPNQS
jgi:hypothetical protein